MGTKRLGLARTKALLENLKREIQLNQATLVGQKAKVLTMSNGLALTADDSGAYCLFAAAGATAVTLPTPQVGLTFTFFTTVTATADHVIKTATLNTDGFLGGCISNSTTVTKADAFSADADASNDHITLNGSTTGGLAGSRLTLVCIDGENWAVSGQLVCSGDPATPFDDAQL